MRIKYILIFLSFILTFTLAFNLSQAASLIDHVRGRILLQVESKGEAWYVNPDDDNRYYMKDGDAAYDMMRSFGLGITNTDLYKIPIGIEERFQDQDADNDGLSDKLEEALNTDPNNPDSDGDNFIDGDEIKNNFNPLGSGTLKYDTRFARALKGKILLQVESRGEAWYVHIDDGKRYYMKDGDAAYQIMKFLSLGITDFDLNAIPAGKVSDAPATSTTHERYTLTIDRGTFDVDVVIIPRDEYNLVTDTAENLNCKRDCAAKTLESYVYDNNADIGIHGSYFCPPDYSECQEEINSFLSPVYNTRLKKMINDDILIFHNGSMITADDNGVFRHYHRPIEFNSVVEFEVTTGRKLVAAIANKPSLIEGGVVIVEDEPLENNFLTKAVRGGIGYNSRLIYAVIARSASVVDLAYIMQSLGATEALNLDGGGSAALYYFDRYVVGPGRLLPNAIVFTKK